MHAVEAPPLAHAQWSQQEMGQHGRILPLRLNLVEHPVHDVECGAEARDDVIAAQRLSLHIARLDRQRRFATVGEIIRIHRLPTV